MNCKLTLGEKLKDLRTAAGLSLVELEEATGISKSALSSYESDDTKKEITI
ncbi:MAG: helix-turn-helix transcriptional regulator, partial [Alphaproteobacteria bacterium]|nr:helix-turn-helix transcriptional regulator [Alphaproteobacteria bacterium]